MAKSLPQPVSLSIPYLSPLVKTIIVRWTGVVVSSVGVVINQVRPICHSNCGWSTNSSLLRLAGGIHVQLKVEVCYCVGA